MLEEKFNDFIFVVLFANIKGISSPKKEKKADLIVVLYKSFSLS